MNSTVVIPAITTATASTDAKLTGIVEAIPTIHSKALTSTEPMMKINNGIMVSFKYPSCFSVRHYWLARL